MALMTGGLMKVKSYRVAGLILCGLLALAACPGAFAQGPPPGGGPGGFPPPGGGPPGGGPPHGPRADFLSSEMRFGDRPVKGAPYSAQFVTESTQTLADGTRISRKSNG